jgi:hypothetical protein
MLACSGEIMDGGSRGADPDDSAAEEAGPASVGEDDGAVGGDPGWVPMHRLNRLEYDNTIRDLLGVPTEIARTSFAADEVLYGFDSIASAHGINDARYEMYFEAAESVVGRAFSDPGLRARVVSCTPSSPDDDDCTRGIIERFGLRAWRRPLSEAELDDLVALADATRALGEDHAAVIRQVVRVMLASPQFLYRADTRSKAGSSAPGPMDGYALASRLSYLLWSTMPDDELFSAAADGSLLRPEVLQAHFARMVVAPEARNFLTSFGGQWLGLRSLATHQVEATSYPAWSDLLRASMIEETFGYLELFLDDRPMREFFTADVNVVDARLAKHYGLAASPAEGARVSVVEGGDARLGFLGLASFLTLTSFSHRTSPTLRGIWVLENLLCEHIPPPPPLVAELDPPAADAKDSSNDNVRARLDEHRKRPDCASCHNLLDPIGLGLENFDAIGRHRERYADGQPIDASGTMPDGSTFDGLHELADLLAKDPRFLDCVVDRAATYALSRGLTKADGGYKRRLLDVWQRGDGTLVELLSHIVASGPFRYRRGEDPATQEAQP